jgi:hypothetical protein
MFFVTLCNVFENKYPLRTIVKSAALLTFLNVKKNIQEGQKAGNVGQGVFTSGCR